MSVINISNITKKKVTNNDNLQIVDEQNSNQYEAGIPELLFRGDLYPNYRNELIQYFRENYEFCKDELGVAADAEEVIEAKQKYQAILSNPIQKCTDMITDTLFEMYDAVGGDYETYYSKDFIALTLCRNLIELKSCNT